MCRGSWKNRDAQFYEREDAGIEEQARAENLKEFLSVAKEYEEEQRRLGNDDITYAGFLEYVSLSSDADTKAAADEGENKVTLMTVHSAKGLEFPVVFMVGLEDGIFPSRRSVEESPDAIDEERRLCYVAITKGDAEALSCKYRGTNALRKNHAESALPVHTRASRSLCLRSRRKEDGRNLRKAPADI